MITDMVIKIVLLGICVSLINLFLNQYQKSFVTIVNIVYIVIVVLMVIDNILDAVQSITDLLSVSSGVNKMFICLYKSAGICILTKIASDICKESGNTVVSDMIDFGGRISLLVISLPFIESIIKTAAAFVK